MRPSEGAADRVAPAGTAEDRQRIDSLIEHGADGKQGALTRLGEMLKAAPKATGGEHGGKPRIDGSRVEPSNPTPTLADLGIDKPATRDTGKQAGANLHGSALDALCDLLRISRRTGYLAAKLLRIGCAELIAEVEAGRISLHLALQIARFTHDGQRLILAAIEGMAPRQRTRMVRLILTDAEQARNSGLSQSASGKVAS